MKKPDSNKAFIEKLSTLTFGTGAKPPKVQKVKMNCPTCQDVHDALVVGPIPMPVEIAKKIMAAAMPPKPKDNEETSFAA